MLIIVFGTPSPLTLWGIHAVRTMARVALGEFRFVEAVVIEDLRRAWREGVGTNLIYFADSPDAEIARIFLNLAAPIIIFADEPRDVVGFSMKARQLDFIGALRFTVQNLAALHELLLTERALLITRDRAGMIARTMFESIARHCGLELTEDELDVVASELAPDPSGLKSCSAETQILHHIASAKPPGTWSCAASSAERNLANAVLSDYEQALRGAEIELVTWPREMFSLSTPQGALLSAPVQLTGPRRMLIHGPYLHLPRGRWIATVHFEVGDNLSGSSLEVDVVSDQVLAAGRVLLPQSGCYRFSLPFACIEPRRALEVRFTLERGAIEGWFDLIKVAMMPIRGEYTLAEPAAISSVVRGIVRH